MIPAGHFDESELQAYLDGRLTPDRAKVAAAYLEQSPADAERLAAYAAQRDALKAALQFKFDEPVPPSLSVARIRAEQRRRQMGRMSAIAAMLIIAVGSLVIGLAVSPYLGGGDKLVAEAMDVRGGSVAPEQSVTAATLGSPEARDKVVHDLLAVQAKVPDLAKAGFTLADMKVYPAAGGRDHALEIVYRDARGRTFTLYMRKSVGSDRFDLERKGDTQICIWQNEDLSVVMLSEMPAKEMLKVATLTYSDLNF